VIVFDLKCGSAHVFEAWFGSSGDYDAQVARGLVACPICGSGDIAKAVMAPAVPAKSNRGPSPAQVKQRLAAMAAAQAEALKACDYVGPNFAAEARAIDAGEAASRGIWGEATRAEAAGLAADGIAAHPLPFPVPAKADA